MKPRPRLPLKMMGWAIVMLLGCVYFLGRLFVLEWGLIVVMIYCSVVDSVRTYNEVVGERYGSLIDLELVERM